MISITYTDYEYFWVGNDAAVPLNVLLNALLNLEL